MNKEDKYLLIRNKKDSDYLCHVVDNFEHLWKEYLKGCGFGEGSSCEPLEYLLTYEYSIFDSGIINSVAEGVRSHILSILPCYMTVDGLHSIMLKYLEECL